MDTRPVSDLWDNGYLNPAGTLLFALVTILAAIGYLIRMRTRITFLEIFPVLYLIPITIAPAVYGTRYLIPVIPLYVYYALIATRQWRFLQHRKLEKPVFITLTAAIALTYAAKYTTIDYGPIPDGIAKAESVQLFDFIRTNTDPEDVFIFRKPRVLALLTNRDAAVYHMTDDSAQLWDYFGQINARYIIVGRPFREDMGFLMPFLQPYGRNLEEVFTNADFKLYRIKSR